MTGCPVAESSRERMLQQETSAVQRWIDGMTEQGVNGYGTMTEVGDDQVGLQYGLAGSDMVKRDPHGAWVEHAPIDDWGHGPPGPIFGYAPDHLHFKRKSAMILTQWDGCVVGCR